MAGALKVGFKARESREARQAQSLPCTIPAPREMGVIAEQGLTIEPNKLHAKQPIGLDIQVRCLSEPVQADTNPCYHLNPPTFRGVLVSL